MAKFESGDKWTGNKNGRPPSSYRAELTKELHDARKEDIKKFYIMVFEYALDEKMSIKDRQAPMQMAHDFSMKMITKPPAEIISVETKFEDYIKELANIDSETLLKARELIMSAAKKEDGNDE